MIALTSCSHRADRRAHFRHYGVSPTPATTVDKAAISALVRG
jgi:hypothetical protein